MADNSLKFLSETNDWLETVPKTAIEGLNNSIIKGENMTQEKVDSICVWLSWKINLQIERVRQACLKALYGMYKNTVAGQVMNMASTIKNFVSDPLGAIGDFAGSIFGPVPKVFGWLQTLMTEIPRLAKNLASIVASLPPAPPSPNINFDKFKIKVKTISLSTITSNPNKLPSPESMFPEPPKPFSKDSFQDMFANANAKLKSNKLVYKLTEEQRQSILSGDTLNRNYTNNSSSIA